MCKKMENVKEYFEKVYDETNVKIRLYLVKRCKDMMDVNDIFQEVYLEFYDILERKGNNYVKKSEALLLNLARKKLHAFYHKWNIIPERISLKDEQVSLLECNHNDHIEIEDRIVNEQLIEKLKSKLSEKDGDIQKIFYLRFAMEFSISEIAKTLNLKEMTVKNKLYRTINEFRAEYREEVQNERAKVI